MIVCTYCGNEATEDMQRFQGCCGEMHFDEIEECPECGGFETLTSHHEGDAAAPECTYQWCGECGHQWNHG